MNKLSLLLAVVFLVVACSTTNQQSRPLYSGSQGVIVSFPDKNNYQQYQDESFTVALRVENDGARDVPLGWITVVYDRAVLTPITRPVMTFTLKGRDKDVTLGDVNYTEFSFKANNLTSNREIAETPLSFQACYPYMTTFIQNLCIDRDSYNTQSTKMCLGQTLSGSSQGAPVAITMVEPRFMRGGDTVTLQLRIRFQNLQNGGYVLWDNSTSAGETLCTLNDFNREQFNKLYVKAALNNIPFECGVDGVVRFQDLNTGEVLCRYPETIEPGANYETSLVIQLHYFYISTETAKVQVKR